MGGAAAERRWLALALAGGLAASCAAARPPPSPPLSAADYEAVQGVLSRSPQAREELALECRRGTAAAAPAQERAAMAAILDVDPEDVPEVFCARLVAAIARGDLDHADYERLQSGSEDAGFLRRLVRALRRGPGEYAI